MRFTSFGFAIVLLIASTTHSTEIIARGHVIRGNRPDVQHRMPFGVGDKIELRYRLGDIDRSYGVHGCSFVAPDSTCQRTRIAVDDISGHTSGNPNGHAEFYMKRLQPPSPVSWGFPYTLQMKTANKDTGDWFYLNLLDSARLRMRYLDPDGAVLVNDVGSDHNVTLSIKESADWLSGFNLIDLPTTTLSTPQDQGGYVVTELQVIHDLAPGDADGDGWFDQRDLVEVLSAGRYLTGRRASWSQGDWNADGVFNQADIGAVLRQFPAADRFAAVSVPEPLAILLWFLAILAIQAVMMKVRYDRDRE